jgi:hypothetical protein
MTATIADKLVEFAERLTNYPNGNPARMDALHCMNQLFQDPSITGSPAAIQIIAFDQYLSELCYYLQHFDTIGQFPDRNSICKQELMRLSERNVQRALPQIKRLDLEISKLLLEYREAIADDQLGCFASTDGFIQRESMEGVLLSLEQLLANSKRELELIECRREEMEIQVAPTAAVEPPLVRGSMPELIFHSSQTTEETAAEGQLIAEDELQYFDNFDDDDSSLSINISQPPSPSLPFSTPHNPLPLDEMIATATENDVLYDIDESEDWAYRGGLL